MLILCNDTLFCPFRFFFEWWHSVILCEINLHNFETALYMTYWRSQVKKSQSERHLIFWMRTNGPSNDMTISSTVSTIKTYLPESDDGIQWEIDGKLRTSILIRKSDQNGFPHYFFGFHPFLWMTQKKIANRMSGVSNEKNMSLQKSLRYIFDFRSTY